MPFLYRNARIERSEPDERPRAIRPGGTSLVIHAPIPDEEMRKWNLEPLREPRGSGVVVTLTPENVDHAHDALIKKGADVIFPPRDAPWGVRMFMLKDPNGFLIEVSKPLSGGGC